MRVIALFVVGVSFAFLSWFGCGSAFAQGAQVGQKGAKAAAPRALQPGGPNQAAQNQAGPKPKQAAKGGGQQPGGGLMAGMQAGGAAVNHGIGRQVSQWAHQGIHGQQLAAMIHQLKANKGHGQGKGKGNAKHGGGPVGGGQLAGQPGGQFIQPAAKVGGKGAQAAKQGKKGQGQVAGFAGGAGGVNPAGKVGGKAAKPAAHGQGKGKGN